MPPTRRDILTYGAAGAVASLTPSVFGQGVKVTALTTPTSERRGDMLFRDLGTTGEKVSLIGLGGFHIGLPDTDEEATRIIHAAVDQGITFLDNCWDYHNGNSEVRMGRALSGGRREKAFLMTKIDGRTKAAASSQIDQSLTRLQTDHVDLLQFHEILRFEDPDRVFADGGALEAALEAKQKGKVRFIGFTGHKHPQIHLRMLEAADAHGFKFDAVQMPLNVMDAHFRSFQYGVLPKLVEKGIAALAMKTFGDHFILDRVIKDRIATPVEMLHYSMNLPVAAVVTGIDRMEILDQALEAARTFKPLTPAEVALIIDRTREVAMTGETELFKTSNHFDGTAKNPDWLG